LACELVLFPAAAWLALQGLGGAGLEGAKTWNPAPLAAVFKIVSKAIIKRAGE
jgi:hypothetical protein